MNEETAKVKIDAMQEIVRAIARAEAEKAITDSDYAVIRAVVTSELNKSYNTSPSLRKRVAELERQVSEMREATKGWCTVGVDRSDGGDCTVCFIPVSPKPTPEPAKPQYIRILPHCDPGADLPVGTVADYLINRTTHRVTKTAGSDPWRFSSSRDGFTGNSGVLSIISIPEPTPRDIDTMSIDDCRCELLIKSDEYIPNTPDEQRKLPEGWRFNYIELRSDGYFCASAVSTTPGICKDVYAPDRDLAEWRLRVACERAVKSQ